MAVTHNCGLFGIYNDKDVRTRALQLGVSLFNRGQEACGLGFVLNDGSFLLYHHNGTFSELYQTLGDFKSYSCIGHTRYSNTGSSTERNIHPVKHGSVAVAHNGNLVNGYELRERYASNGLRTELDTEAIACIIDEEGSIPEGIRRCENECVGSFNLAIVNNRGEMGFYRDSSGNHPLVWAEHDDSVYVASEDIGLKSLHFRAQGKIPEIITSYRELEPGQLLLIDKKGVRLEQVTEPREHFCWMEILYFMRHGSEIRGVPVADIRRRLGRRVAEKYKHWLDDSMVFSYSPESGRDYAIGGAKLFGAYPEDIYSVNRSVGRVYISPEGKGEKTPLNRIERSMLKCPPIVGHIAGRDILVFEDTAVRANNIRAQAMSAFSVGANTFNVLVSGPPIRYPCFTGMDHQDRAQLAAAPYETIEEANRGVARKISDGLGIDERRVKVGYLSFDEMNDVVQESTGGIDLCSACYDGDYWFDVPERLRTKLQIG